MTLLMFFVLGLVLGVDVSPWFYVLAGVAATLSLIADLAD